MYYLIISLCIVYGMQLACVIMSLIFEDVSKKTIRLLLIPFGFIVYLKRKYDNLEEE